MKPIPNSIPESCLPAGRCVFCQQTLETTGGRRMVAQHNLAVMQVNGRCAGGHPRVAERVLPLEAGSDTGLLLRGKPGRWSEAAIARARRDALAGLHPWFCQRCAGRVCRACGTPAPHPMGADLLDAQGRITHLAIFPFNPGCDNPQCTRYKPREQQA